MVKDTKYKYDLWIHTTIVVVASKFIYQQNICNI